MIRQASFAFDAEMVRSSDAASEDSARLIWLMLTFIRVRAVGFDHYRGAFARSERTFKRDIAKLRELGSRYGFVLTPQREKVVRLVRFEGRPSGNVSDDAAADAVRALSDAFGAVLASSLAGVAQVEGTTLDRFLRIAMPRLRQQSAVAKTYHELREAWRANAKIRFRYPVRGKSATAERSVEPYATTYHAGRYYLVGFDVRPRSGGWRQFALDRMQGPFARVGTFVRRTIPDAYRGEDAVGLFKTGPKTAVVIEISSQVADAVLAREWQRAERIERRPDGSATITFQLYDLAEGVRWACAFGTEARVLEPPAAVDLARSMTAAMFAQYEPSLEALAGVS